MKYAILCFWILVVLISCNGSQNAASGSSEDLARIDSLEAVLFAVSEEPANSAQGMELVRLYAEFYENNKNDSLAIDMLFKAGEVSMGIGQGIVAVKYFSTISRKHDTFYKAPEAMFLSGFCEENLNKDTAEARRQYEKFIEMYPDHRLAHDAKFSIKNMKMSDEELIKMFREKNKGTS